mmetsp:Transcript_9437/g.13856  ORF Transcript_9437/g.13856 Transcript_9437/m.13856 type:complete len:164 (-) Transcript_9437:917-1408(-)
MCKSTWARQDIPLVGHEEIYHGSPSYDSDSWGGRAIPNSGVDFQDIREGLLDNVVLADNRYILADNLDHVGMAEEDVRLPGNVCEESPFLEMRTDHVGVNTHYIYRADRDKENTRTMVLEGGGSHFLDRRSDFVDRRNLHGEEVCPVLTHCLVDVGDIYEGVR